MHYILVLLQTLYSVLWHCISSTFSSTFLFLDKDKLNLITLRLEAHSLCCFNMNGDMKMERYFLFQEFPQPVLKKNDGKFLFIWQERNRFWGSGEGAGGMCWGREEIIHFLSHQNRRLNCVGLQSLLVRPRHLKQLCQSKLKY